ncbi:BatD family protein [Vibrio sp. FNV 38]|nr:BatD family protein [Vibrio sp. FNV 38]
MKIMRFTQPLWFALLLIIGATISLAQAATLQATVSKRELVANEVFQLRIVADQRASSDDIDLSVLDEDFFVGRPNFGTSINIVNSQRTTRSEWNVSLAAQHIGRYTIPSFKLNGTRTEPIYINVTKDEYEPEPKDFIEVTNQLQRDSLYPQESTQLLSRVIIKTDPRRLQNPEISQPKVEGMTLKSIGDAKQYNSVLDGVEITVVEQAYSITADQPGDYTLTGVGFDGTIVFGDSLRGSTRLIAAPVAPTKQTILVKTPPKDYVGDWLPTQSLTMTQKFLTQDGQQASDEEQINISVGQSLTREVTIDIQGLDAERFPNLSLPIPNSFRVYSEKPSFQSIGGGVTRMIIKQVLIAQKEDQVAIILPSIDWWDSRNNIAEKTTEISTNINIAPAEQTLYSIDTTLPNNQEITPAIQGVSVYWQYIAIVMSLLLPISIAYIIYLRKKILSLPRQRNEDQTVNVDQGLETIIRQGDVSLTNFHINKWLTKNSHIPDSVRNAIHKQISEMNSHQYSKNNDDWDNKALIELINKAQILTMEKITDYNLPKL